ncbi:hypothetical protein HYC85_010435 [Camellia sinensis]|uniref:Pentatricopeptide repeat-containing protein n=1 Tax=Camellia sinensis TaxID=4442 RepID=A0A7J7HJR9_CAMSI|nr:hypothetical protein HYC85_010435 [Camellia sinensis]
MSERSLVTWTALVSGYSQNGDSGEALVVFSAMHRIGVNVKANQFTYGSALRACTNTKNPFFPTDLHSKCGKMEDACYIFESMLERDVVSWNAMIGGYAVQGFVDDALRLIRSMLRVGHVAPVDCEDRKSLTSESERERDRKSLTSESPERESRLQRSIVTCELRR